MTVFYPLQKSFPPRRRTAAWVGKPRIKLAEMLDKKLSEMGYESEIECSDIRPQQGAWRTDVRLDVMRVEGHLRIKGPATLGVWMPRNLESWSTITDMVRYGFDVEVGSLEVSIEALGPGAKLTNERCEACAATIPAGESACLDCGHTQDWAQPHPFSRR